MVFTFCQLLEIGRLIIIGVPVNMMNVVYERRRHISTTVLPNDTVEKKTFDIVPVFAFVIGDAVELLVLVVDDFNGRRGGQVAFENVNAVTLKIVFGKCAEFGEQFGDALRLFHAINSLAIRARG